jgi:hypothetical protein
MVNPLLMSAQIVDNFKEILSHVETWIDYHHIFYYSSDALVSLIVLCPRQVPGWPAP